MTAAMVIFEANHFYHYRYPNFAISEQKNLIFFFVIWMFSC